MYKLKEINKYRFIRFINFKGLLFQYIITQSTLKKIIIYYLIL